MQREARSGPPLPKARSAGAKRVGGSQRTACACRVSRIIELIAVCITRNCITFLVRASNSHEPSNVPQCRVVLVTAIVKSAMRLRS